MLRQMNVERLLCRIRKRLANQALEPPANSVRCAPAIGGGSPPTFGYFGYYRLTDAAIENNTS